MSEELANLNIGLIGGGVIGERRLDVALKTGLGRPVMAYDPAPERAALLERKFGLRIARSADEIIESPEVGIAVIATPNHCLAELGTRALSLGKHVLIEKPGAIAAEQIDALVRAQGDSGLVCKIGYNHRFHPAAQRLLREVSSGNHGRILWIRAAYGHGGRPGYEKEWRFNRELSGGGEIIDQGVHLLDLVQGCGDEIFSLQFASRLSAFYPSTEEDNGFLVLQSLSGAVAQLHCSVTQWKNLFRFEVATERALLTWDGLGNPNYGEERLTIYRRKPQGGAPDREVLDFGLCGMESWEGEWRHFYGACVKRDPRVCSSARDSRWIFGILTQVRERSRVISLGEAGKA
jgi:predicted dehydrogenase